MKSTNMVLGGLALVVALVNPACICANVAGNEAGILETCSGVEGKVYPSGTHFFSPICNDFYVYNVGTQLLTMKSTVGQSWETKTEGADEPCFAVQLKGGQKACLDLRTEYQIATPTLVALHKSVKQSYEAIIIRPAVIRNTKNLATRMTADEVYADATQVTLEKAIEQALLEDDDLRRAGIGVHSFIIEAVHLDPNYESEVRAKSVAQQTTLKEIELAKAAEEAAKRVASEAKAQVEKERAEAEAAKIKTVMAAEAERLASEQRAQGLLAQGKAEAEVARLKRDALYSGESGAWRARVEIAQARAVELKGMLAGVQVIPANAVLQLVNGDGVRPAAVTPVVNASGSDPVRGR